MKEPEYYFFDLDHTLWDTDRNSEESLKELYIHFKLHEKGLPSFDLFHKSYKGHNERLWNLYAENKIGKHLLRTHRFRLTFQDFGVDDDDSIDKLAEEFIKLTPTKGHLIDGAHDLLEQLMETKKLAIITNGFKETQHTKINSSGLDRYFPKEFIYISEVVGAHKPDRVIFEYAMWKRGAQRKSDCLMIGDTYATDIIGAINAGWKAVHLTKEPMNNSEIITIDHLSKLQKQYQ